MNFMLWGAMCSFSEKDVKKIAIHIDIMIKINNKKYDKSAGHEPVVLSSMP
jgi:hypothetical protein